MRFCDCTQNDIEKSVILRTVAGSPWEFFEIVHAIPGATLVVSPNPSLDFLSSRSALKELRSLSATPTGSHPRLRFASRGMTS